MPRRVIVGTEANPITVRPADLPQNADFSYLRHVRLTGTWGARRSLRYVDLIQSRCDASLREANITGIASWRTDCEGIRILPSQADTCTFDFIRGYGFSKMREYMTDVLQADTADIDKIMHSDELRNIDDVDKDSWPSLIDYWATTLGVSKAKVGELLRHVLSDLPQQEQQARDSDGVTTPVEELIIMNDEAPQRIQIPLSQFSADMMTEYNRKDRFALSRAAEVFVTARLGKSSKAGCLRIKPLDFMCAVGSLIPDSDWPYL